MSDRSIPALTDEQVLSAMDPNGTTMKYGEIVAEAQAQLESFSSYLLYRAVDRVLQRMKRAGRVELVKGRGGGWRIKVKP